MQILSLGWLLYRSKGVGMFGAVVRVWRMLCGLAAKA